MDRFVLAALAAFIALAVALPASAHSYTLGPLDIGHPWSRATPKGAAVGGGYLRITNNGNAPDRLIGGSAAVAGKVEIHEMKMEGGVMKMRPLSNGVTIGPGETVELKPGGIHLMFMGLKKPLVEGESFKGTLVFEKGGKIEVDYKIDKLAAPSSGHGGSHGNSHGGMKH